MEKATTEIEILFERIEDYTKTSAELIKLRAVEKATEVVVAAVSKISIVLIISVCSILLTIGLAFLTGELLGKVYYGFFLMAACCLIMAAVFHLWLEKWLKKPLSNRMIDKMLS